MADTTRPTETKHPETEHPATTARRRARDTEYQRYERLRRRLLDIFSQARAYGLPHAEILELRARIFASPDYQRSRQYHRFALAELFRLESDHLYREALEWRLGPAAGPVALADQDAWTDELSALSRTPGALYGAHFYRGRLDRPFAPYVPIN